MSDAPVPSAGSADDSRGLRIAIGVALAAAAVRLIPLQFLHPLQWDELEFYRAAKWIADGRLPYRDFWEHHTPLAWFLFAPATWLSSSSGVIAVIALRWAQLPLWISTFWLLNAWMRRSGIEPFARWAAMALALASSFFMIPAIEYRVDTLGCLLVVAGLVLAQRNAFFWSGAAFCLAAFANLRLGPMLVVAVVLLRLVHGPRANRLIAGGLVTLAAGVAVLAATGSLAPMWQQVFLDNRLGDAYATRVNGSLAHRLLSPFGVRLLASSRLFDPAGVDPGAVALLLLGFTGVVIVVRECVLRATSREPVMDERVVIAATQVASLFFIGSMKFIYNYHFEIVVVLMVPLAAIAIQRIRATRGVAAILVLAILVSVFASVFRGKELDRAYQDRIMREVTVRTRPDDAVFSGAAWAIRREPVYRFWFLPDLARQLVLNGHAKKLVMTRMPGAIIADHNALVWMHEVQRELLPVLARHYVPVWRDLLTPGLNARLTEGSASEWIVPRSGTYRVHVSSRLAAHPWFAQPFGVIAYKGPARLTVTLDVPAPDPRLQWAIDGRPAVPGATIELREHQRLGVRSTAQEPLAVFLLPTDERVLFRQPPPGVSIDAELPRTTHVPRFGARIEP